MGESRPIPEGAYPEGTEAKPEPEVVAAALLMSEGESSDLGKTRPDSVFHQLFSSSSPDRAVGSFPLFHRPESMDKEGIIFSPSKRSA